jgi:cyclopropane fatty-acyl-phospholipid synthase-like methyltransferase
MKTDTPNFDSVACAYRWMEHCSFGRLLERCRFHFLPRCSSVRRALVLGDGDGRFTARLLAENSTVTVDAVDASPAMLAVLRERVRHNCRNADMRLSTTAADIRQLIPARSDYDLVASHFFLDCLTDGEVRALIARLSQCMTPDALWLVSDFDVPEKGWRRLGGQIVIRSLYFAFFVLTGLKVRKIPNYAIAFNENGFHQVDKAAFLGGMLVTELWQRRSS